MSSGAVNPGHIVAVIDFSAETLREIADHIEASTRFEHFVYREAELDAVWSLTGFAMLQERDASKRAAAAQVRDAAHRVHDLIGEEKPREALETLRAACAAFSARTFSQLARLSHLRAVEAGKAFIFSRGMS